MNNLRLYGDHARRSFIAVVMFAILLVAISGQMAYAQVPEFDGNSAFTFLYRQVELGPRIPGSKAHQQAVDDFRDWFERCGGEVQLQEFEVKVNTTYRPDSEMRTVQARNIIARFGPPGKATYILSAHYDTRPWADLDPDSTKRLTPIPGANDGASGVAVLLEMARLFTIQPPPVTIEIVLFDVEDSGVAGKNDSYCLGSAYYAKHYAGTAPAGAVLLDMIGDSDLEIAKEYFSYVYAREWTDYLFTLAEDVGSFVFLNRIGEAIYDDHVNLIRGGIPAVDLIDFEYPWWHTLEDTPDKCSAESLEQVGRVLVRLIYGE